MPADWTLEKAFQHFGAGKKNLRSSVSARNEDTKLVVLALWKDRFDFKSKPIAYERFRPEELEAWRHQPAHKEQLEDLMWARDHCDGLFRVVIAVPKDPKAIPREMAECYPQDKLVMKLTHLNPESGQFRAVQADI